MEHIYLDNMDKLAGTGKHLIFVFMAPDRTTVMFTLKETETHKALITKHSLEFVGLCGLVDGSPEFEEQRPLPANARAAIDAHYRVHVEQKRAEAMNAARIQPASEPTYSWGLKKYLH